MEEENAKKSKTTKIIIILVIALVAIIALGIGGYFAYMKLNGTGTEWGDVYYKYAKDLSGNIDEISSLKEPEENSQSYKYGLPYGVKDDVKAEFVDIDSDNTPEMITSYTYGEGMQGVTIYYIKDNTVSYYPPREGTDIVLLYNIENKQYNYYIHNYIENSKQHIYSPAKQNEDGSVGASINFTDEEMKSKLDVADGEIPVLSKFDQTFIKIEDEKEQFDIKANMDESEIKDSMKTSVEDYKGIEEIVTDEVKTETENKVTEIETKKEEIKKAEEEKAKREAEEKARAEEEARKKAEEEVKKGLKVGNYTLKYGSYKCNMDGVAAGTYTINSDGTFTFKNNWENVRNEKYTDTGSGTVTAYFSKGDDYDPTDAWVVKFTFTNYHSTYEPSNSYKPDFNVFDVTSNNRFQYRQGAGTFIYQGN